MVGVPRSKTCFRCLDKRKRCDSRRPGCGQCERKDVPCPGYRARFRFVVQDGVSVETHSQVGDAPRPHLSQGEATAEVKPSGGSGSGLQLLPSSLQSTAGQLELFARFHDIYHPRRRDGWRPLPTDLDDLPSWEWILSSVQHSQRETLLGDAVLALILGTLGCCEKNSLYKHAGFALHARAVKRLKKQLDNRQDCLSDSTLSAVMVFGIYEIQIGSEGRGRAWLAHVRGVDALLQLRGDSVVASPFAKQLMWASQYNRWVIAMRFGERSLTPPSVPFSQVGEMPIPADVHLFSILQQIAPLLAKLDQFRVISSTCCDDQKVQIASSLNWKVDQLIDELKAWADPTGLLCWDEPSTLYPSIQPSTVISNTFATMFCFPSIRVATSTLFLWTGLHFLFMIKQALEPALPMQTITAARCDEVGLYIARSFEYFLHPDIGAFGTYIIGFPLNVVRAYFEQRDVVGGLSWLEVVEARIVEVNSGLGDFLKEVRSENLLPRPIS